ncbi:hypothetical protein K458DRAFT_385447 [Lentithecium fluviatile CBS 122367]|uniref:Uncharacterized protein n=1 Tax=Lentithecium fluviatile CBS 122367 TaxID=1168545 RepID=A0A6G1JBT2_9PLEO|nr:hypothetical protein K458DRAFT_385447 [Lentithecium fluviatile CBS 122367]
MFKFTYLRWCRSRQHFGTVTILPTLKTPKYTNPKHPSGDLLQSYGTDVATVTTVHIVSYSYNRIMNPHNHAARAQLATVPIPKVQSVVRLQRMNWQPPTGADCQRYSGVSPQIQNHVRMLPNAMADMYYTAIPPNLLSVFQFLSQLYLG